MKILIHIYTYTHPFLQYIHTPFYSKYTPLSTSIYTHHSRGSIAFEMHAESPANTRVLRGSRARRKVVGGEWVVPQGRGGWILWLQRRADGLLYLIRRTRPSVVNLSVSRGEKEARCNVTDEKDSRKGANARRNFHHPASLYENAEFSSGWWTLKGPYSQPERYSSFS